MGYSFDKHLLQAEHPDKHDLNTEAYLQIAADIPPESIIVFNLQEFTTLVANAVIEQFPAFASFASRRTIYVK